MSYCTVDNVRQILPEKVLIGDSNIGTPSPGRPGIGGGRSNISPQETEKLMILAEQYIDSRLKPFYLTPLRRIKSFEAEVLNDIGSGNLVTLVVNDSGPFIRSQIVRVQDNNRMETCTVNDAPTLTTVVLVHLEHSYLSSNNLNVSLLEYPDPIPVIAARLTASFILDRLFVSEQAPDVSQYGKTQRNLASMALDDILRGVVALFGQEMTGRRFVRGSLLDKFSSPAEVTKGEEKE